MQAVAFAVLVAAALLCLAAALRILYRGLAILRVSTTTADWNTDDVAAKHFVGLLEEAEECMVVYDDGNDMEGSIYQDDAVIDAVRSKLARAAGFRLGCCFNFDHDLPFTKALRGLPGVEIRTGQGYRPEDDVHYKIIDRGRKAHLSRHALASKDRRYKVVDCTNVPQGQLPQVADAVLGRYKSHAASCGMW